MFTSASNFSICTSWKAIKIVDNNMASSGRGCKYGKITAVGAIERLSILQVFCTMQHLEFFKSYEYCKISYICAS